MMDNLSTTVVDIYFHKCLQDCLKNVKMSMAFMTVRFLILTIFLIVDYTALDPQEPLFLTYMIIVIVYNALCLLSTILFYFLKLTDNTLVLAIALKNSHSIQVDQPVGFLNCEATNTNVSTVYYNFENMEEPFDVPEAHKTARENIGKSQIMNTLRSDSPCFNVAEVVLSISSLGMFVFGMIVAITVPISEAEHSIIEFFLVTEVLYRMFVYAIATLILLVPLICLVLCLYSCFCSKNKKANIPQKAKATADQANKVGECPICYQLILEGEDIIALQCSPLHAFHDICINGWVKVKPTCPVCRFDLTT